MGGKVQRLVLNVFLDSISDVGANNVSIEGNDQLSWVIGIVSIRNLDSSGPDSHGVDIHDHKDQIEGANQVVPIVLISAHGLNREFEFLVQVILVRGVNSDNWLVNGIGIDRVFIDAQ